MTNAGALCEHLPYKNDSLTHPAEINKVVVFRPNKNHLRDIKVPVTDKTKLFKL